MPCSFKNGKQTMQLIKLSNLDKQEQAKLRRQREIIKIGAEINETEAKKDK
jgi:hypothetical protein